MSRAISRMQTSCLAMAALAASAIGCGGATGGEGSCLCMPGETTACMCPGGATGMQTCAESCLEYQACTCQPGDPGADGGLSRDFASALSPDLRSLPDLAESPDLVEPLPAFVTIGVLNATIAPFKADRTKWDNSGTVVPQLLQDLIDALGDLLGPYGAVAKFLVGKGVTEAVKGTDKPDPFGTIEVLVGGMWSKKIVLPAIQDTFNPSWAGPPGWQKVPFTKSLRVRIHLEDEDIFNDDPVGDAEINYDEILATLQSQKIRQVQVNDQTQNQILFVGVSVVGQ